MHRVTARVDRALTGSMARYAVAGALVAAAYLSLPVVVSAVFGVPIQIVIPIAYVLAVMLHLRSNGTSYFGTSDRSLCRASSRQCDISLFGRSSTPATAVATAVLPGVLGLSARQTYVCAAVAFSVMFFLFLRTRVFHAAG